MFLLPSLLVGIGFALLLGGRPSRLADVRFRASWAVVLALAVQVLLFSRLGVVVPDALRQPAHLATYALLLLFAVLNLRLRTLLPVVAGMTLNAIAIGANGGNMPISRSAAHAAGITALAGSNVSQSAGHLRFLGDVFALPSALPLANAFSIGDILIGLGVAGFIVAVSLGGAERSSLDPRRLLEPLTVPAYRRLALGRLVSQLGDWLALAGLVGWIYDTTHSTGQVAILILSRLVPPILGGGIAAIIVDRLPKQRLLSAIEALRGAAISVALVGVLCQDRTAVFAALAVSGALAAIGNATAPALLPALVSPDRLAAANAALGIAKDGAMALGALGAGIVLSVLGIEAALAADLATFAIALLLYRSLRHVPGAATAARPMSDRGGGLRYLLRRRTLLTLVIAFATATLATGLTNASLPRFLDDAVAFGSSGYGFGLAALAGGLTLGQALIGFSKVGATAGRWVGAALLLMSGLFVLLGLSRHAPTVLLILGAIGFIDGTTDVIFDTVLQREAEQRYLGSIFGIASAFITTTMVTAIAIAPLLNRVLDPNTVILVAAAALVAAGSVALIGLRTQPAPNPRLAGAPEQ